MLNIPQYLSKTRTMLSITKKFMCFFMFFNGFLWKLLAIFPIFYLNRVLGVRVVIVTDPLEEILAQPGDDPRLVIIVTFPHHRVALSSPGLTVGEDADIVAVK